MASAVNVQGPAEPVQQEKQAEELEAQTHEPEQENESHQEQTTDACASDSSMLQGPDEQSSGACPDSMLDEDIHSDEEVMVDDDDSDDPDSDIDGEDTCCVPKCKLVPVLLLLKTKLRHGLTYSATTTLIDLINIFVLAASLILVSLLMMLHKGRYKTFNFFIDGLKVTSSSKKSAWPVLCTLNNLSPVKKRKHILMASLWLGKDKPVCNEYLRPFVQECIELATVGVDYTVNGLKRNVKFRAAMCIADSVARPAIRNSTLFSGNFGCGLCVHPGEWTPKGKGGMMSYSPIHEENLTGDKIPVWYPRKRHNQTMLDAEEAELSGICQRGIVGKSVLSQMPWFDIVNFLDADVMHIIMNVGKMFCKLWFKTKNDGKPFNISKEISQVNSRLNSFHPTSEISRAPRSLEHYADFKAHEWAVWILIYSLVALKGILPSKYFEHWALLVSALSRLTHHSVRVSEVLLSRREIRDFVAGTHTLYGMNCVTFNVHLLSHLPESVLNFGNLWTHSAFLYGSYNSVLKNSVRSSNGIINQIVMEFKTRAAVQFMEADLNSILSAEEKQYLSNLSSSSSKPNITKDLGYVQFFGKPEVRVLENNEFYALRREGVVLNRNSSFNFYSRCNFEGLMLQ
ncbi:hypothetical protein FOCC_FOCC015086, partial [Frankliniella occidentalis]